MRVVRSVMEQIEAHVVEGYPNEICGILAGPPGDVVTEAHRVRNINVERARERYLMEPRDQIRIERDLDARGLSLLGYYHSHPDHPAQASATDAGAAWAGPAYVIVSCYGGTVRDANVFFAEQDGGPMRQGALAIG